MLGKLERITLSAGRSFRVLRWSDSLGKVDSLMDGGQAEPITGQGQHWHYHVEMELTAFTAGEGTFFVGDYIGSFAAGEVVLLGENLPHYWQARGSCAGFSIQWNFPPEHAFWTFPESACLGGFFTKAGHGIRYVGSTAATITTLLRELASASSLDRLSLLLRLLSLLANAPRSDLALLSSRSFSLPDNSVHRRAISDALRYLLANYRSEIRLQEVLHLTRMSKATFSRQFKRHSGKTFSEFVSHLRLRSARRELVETDRTILEIATSCGFSEVSFFNRIFRRMSGCSPSEYRARERRNGNAGGVSVATASRMVENPGGVSSKVEPHGRSALLKPGAGSDRKGQPQTLCFLLANRSMLHPFHAQVLMGAHGFAAGHGKHILFYPFHYAADAPPDGIRLPLLDSVGATDGYIVGGVNSPNLIKRLSATGIPFAVLGNNVVGDWEPEQCDGVWMDDTGGAYELTVHLQRLGHRRICFVGTHQFPAARLEQGYRRAMAQAGLRGQVIENDSKDERESGFIAAKALLSRRSGVTALFAYSDAAAHGVFDAATGCGLSIPGDLSIAGFGDRPEALALSPSLTTVWGYPDQVGRRLAEMVLSRLTNPGAAPKRVVLPTKLIPRNSCRAVAPSVCGGPPKTAAKELLRLEGRS